MTFLGLVPCSSTPSPPKKGVTIGNYDADYVGGDERPFYRALADGHRALEIVNGEFNFAAPLISPIPDIELSARKHVRVYSSLDATIGTIRFSGARARLHGVPFHVRQAVAGQQVVQLEGDDSEAVLCRFVQEGAGNAGLSTHLLSFGNLDNATRTKGHLALGNSFVPNIGSVCLQSLFTDGFRWNFNYFGPEGIATQRDCRAVFATNSSRGQSLNGNVIEYLGTVAQSMDGIWRERPNAITEGGNVFNGNTIRSCRFGQSGIFFSGSKGWSIAGNTIEDITELGAYFWKVESTGGGSEASRINFGTNTFKSVGKSGVGGAIDLASCNRVTLSGVNFYDCVNAQIQLASSDIGGGAVATDSTKTMYLIDMEGCMAVGNGVVPRAVTPSNPVANGWQSANCRAHNFTGGAATKWWGFATITGVKNQSNIWEA